MAGDSDRPRDHRGDARHERRLPPAGSSAAARADVLRRPETWAVAALAAALAALGAVGSDALWLVPLGREIAHGHLPHSIPFAAAPTHGWHDVPAGAELIFWALYRVLGGVRGIVLAQCIAVAVGFGALAAGLRRGAVLVPLVVLAGSIPAVAVAGVQLFSVALFSLLLVLLESESRSIWLAVPLIAIWGNLHGGVLVGLGLLACYTVFRRRPALPVLAASVLAVFANPALWHTPRYYENVFGSVVARDGKGMWGPLGTSGFDIALIVAGLLLLAAIARRPDVRLWEAVALFGLAAVTAHAARTGTFFLFVAAYPASRGLQLRPLRRSVVTSAAVVLSAVAVVLVAKGPSDPGSKRLTAEAARSGRTVLAEPVLGQQVALAGGRIWVDNPVDAFRKSDQQVYIDWLYGSSDAAITHTGYVLVSPTSKAGKRAAHDPRLARVAADAHAILYRVSRGRGS